MLGITFLNISRANVLRSSTFFLKGSKYFAIITPTTTAAPRQRRERNLFTNRMIGCTLAEAPPWVTGDIGKAGILDCNFSFSWFQEMKKCSMFSIREDFSLIETRISCGKERWASHQILRAVQFVCGWSAACDEGLKHGTDDNAFHILGCGFVVHCGEVISKTSLVWNAKEPIKGSFHQATQFKEVLGTQELMKDTQNTETED